MQDGFDTIARSYDAQFTRSRIGSAQRELVRSYLRTMLPEGSRRNILEIGCGTGEDAAWFARKGHHVTATDASKAMLDETENKLVAEGLRAAVELHCARAEEIASAGVGGPFDLIFSNFGGLNCLSPSALGRLAPDLRALLKPGGHLIIVVMPRFCAWETLYFLLRGKPAAAFRRRSGGPVTARIGGSDLPTWYHAPGALAKLLGTAFRPVARRPVGFAIPPSYLEPFIAARPRLFRALESIDRALAGRGVLAPASDHALVDFEALP